MIKPTDQDIGRKVRMIPAPYTVGILRNIEGCGQCDKPCVGVEYGGGWRWWSNPEKLQWADEDLL